MRQGQRAARNDETRTRSQMAEQTGTGAEIVTAGLIVIGDEVLSGRTKDKNIGYVAGKLTETGIQLKEVRIVADDQGAIVEAVNALRQRYDYVFTTGGIGPTHDDITADAIGAAFARPVEMDPRALDIMRRHFRESQLTPARLRMTRMPAGAALIDNPVSVAPGFSVENVYVMAGVPQIMQGMLDQVLPNLRAGRKILSRTLRVSAKEGDIADVLAGLAEIGLSPEPAQKRLAALEKVKRNNGYFDLPDLPAAQGTLHHADVVRGLQSFLGENDMLALDAGANRIWATFGLRMPYGGRLLVAGGTGAMGWGGPAAATAKMVFPGRRVTCLAGDGGFMMTNQIIPTCVQRNLDVVFVVSNNDGLGMVRDNLGEKPIAVDFGSVDFAAVAEGMGGRGLRVYNRDEMRDALEEAHRMGGPVVIDVKVDPDASHHPAVDNGPL